VKLKEMKTKLHLHFDKRKIKSLREEKNEKNFCFFIRVSTGHFFFQPIRGKKENLPGEYES
jgi:hypothetical protein